MEATKTKEFTLAEYLALEENSDIKHEYLDGNIFPMTDFSYNHCLIGANIGAALCNSLKRKNATCSVLNSQMRVHVKPSNYTTYPVASVVCGKPKFSKSDKDSLVNPIVIVEIISTPIKNFDYWEKFDKYRQLHSFKEYIVIHQDEPTIEVLTRQADGNWSLVTVIGQEEIVKLHSIDCQLKMSDIYYRVPDLKAPSFRLFKEE